MAERYIDASDPVLTSVNAAEGDGPVVVPVTSDPWLPAGELCPADIPSYYEIPAVEPLHASDGLPSTPDMVKPYTARPLKALGDSAPRYSQTSDEPRPMPVDSGPANPNTAPASEVCPVSQPAQEPAPAAHSRLQRLRSAVISRLPDYIQRELEDSRPWSDIRAAIKDDVRWIRPQLVKDANARIETLADDVPAAVNAYWRAHEVHFGRDFLAFCYIVSREFALAAHDVAGMLQDTDNLLTRTAAHELLATPRGLLQAFMNNSPLYGRVRRALAPALRQTTEKIGTLTARTATTYALAQGGATRAIEASHTTVKRLGTLIRQDGLLPTIRATAKTGVQYGAVGLGGMATGALRTARAAWRTLPYLYWPRYRQRYEAGTNAIHDPAPTTSQLDTPSDLSALKTIEIDDTTTQHSSDLPAPAIVPIRTPEPVIVPVLSPRVPSE